MEDIGEKRERRIAYLVSFASSVKYINFFSPYHLKKNTPLHSVGTEMMHYARKRE
jgi:hypothetical protein